MTNRDEYKENLNYDGRMLKMDYASPLESYFEKAGIPYPFVYTNTDNMKTYVGTWEILNDRLYLVGLLGTLLNGEKASLSTFFPGYPSRVFAHWHSENIGLSGESGKTDLSITLEKGIVTKIRELTKND